MRYLPPLLILGTLAAAGCDAQLAPQYTGESLLTIVGSVEIPNGKTRGQLIPALAFANQQQGVVEIQDVVVRGQFPADFQLDVFEPPPDAAFVNLTQQTSGEPRIALSYITAVSEDHPDRISFSTDGNTTAFSCFESECQRECGGKGCLVSRTDYCVASDPSVPCYTEETYCPTFDAPGEQCSIVPVGNGDPKLKDSPWDTFAGFSQNYVVAYLESRAETGSVSAAILGSKDSVPAGYGLYAVRVPTEAKSAANDQCTAAAEVQAASAWNDAYDTHLTTLSFDGVCAPTEMASSPGASAASEFAAVFCGIHGDPLGDPDKAWADRNRFIEAAQRDLGCSILGFTLERVSDPAHESVSVVIGPEAQPAFGHR